MGLLYLPTWKVDFWWENKVVSYTILIISMSILDSKTSYKLDWDRKLFLNSKLQKAT